MNSRLFKTPDPACGSAPPLVLRNRAGLWFELLRHGGVRRAGLGDDILGHFVGHEAEAPFANLWLRRTDDEGTELLPLLGPAAGGVWQPDASGQQASFEGQSSSACGTLRWRVHLQLAEDVPAWFWHVQIQHAGASPLHWDVVQVQDIGLTAYGALRLNEHYVSQYVDLQSLPHPHCGTVLAARQNQSVAGRHPWVVMGTLGPSSGWATDGLQVQGLAPRLGGLPEGLCAGLPASRLQHEHACVALQSARCSIAPGDVGSFGFFGRMLGDHPAASGAADLVWVEDTLALPQAQGPGMKPLNGWGPGAENLSWFHAVPWLQTLDLEEASCQSLFGPQRSHEERDDQGALLSWFATAERHVVLRAKELQVLRPHGHLLRSGGALVPDESALTSTVWMGGVFHSMLTQGHVSINRLLSTVHGYLGQFRSHGLRLFVEGGQGWQLLGTPSAFEITPQACRWVYRHEAGLFVVRSAAEGQAMTLSLKVLEGPPLKWRASLHVALGGDDGASPAPLCWQVMRQDEASIHEVELRPPQGSELALRFPQGSFAIEAVGGEGFAAVAGDEALFMDGQSRGEPFLCLDGQAAPASELRISGRLIPHTNVLAAAPLPQFELVAPDSAPSAPLVARVSSILPWFQHNAFIHYLAPRGLEQYSGGGWGTRDVCQGPLEMLLAAGRTPPVRDLLLRTFAAQNPDGDWPQWFMFFQRDRAIRAGDAHGDIVFWPLVGLARYLLASGDAGLLGEHLPFFGEANSVPVWAHVDRALALIDARRIPGTHLAAYGHGDWNDSLQPADPALRERLCSAWTVTLHHQMLTSLAQAFECIGHCERAQALRDEAARVRTDFQRLLLADGVVAGYALFEQGPEQPELLLHPRDRRTGLHHSLLPMMHAVLENLLEPAQARSQIEQIRRHLLAPDGARLFDAPLAYRGGPQRLFQRAESSSYFGREIGVMYVHAHLRWAQTLAHVGDGASFLDALARVNPIGLQTLVPHAGRRQANAYFSSSDAAFCDRYAAQRDYDQVRTGQVRVDGGWRVYSSGPGIFLHLVMKHLVGVLEEADEVIFDPVLPPELDGLLVRTRLLEFEVELLYRTGRRGCGPMVITVDGKGLPIASQHHLYRPGPARVRKSVLRQALAESASRRIVVQLG